MSEQRLMVTVEMTRVLTPARIKKIIEDHIQAAGGKAEVVAAPKMGRPKCKEALSTHPFSVRFEQKDEDDLKRISRAKKATITGTIRRAVRELIERESVQPNGAGEKNLENSTESS